MSGTTGKRRPKAKEVDPPLIFVLDDLETNREIAAAMLLELGCRVETARDSMAAFARLGDACPDLILTDIQMPIMDGFALARAIRSSANPVVRATPILAMTSAVTENDIRAFDSAGINSHVPKPIEMQSLAEAVTAALHRPLKLQGKPMRPAVDDAKLQEIVQVLGTERVGRITKQFVDQLSASFLSTSANARREAHDLVNMAGVLGLEEFVDLCREIQGENAGSGRKYKILIGHARRMKSHVLRICQDEIIPVLHNQPTHQ